MKAGRCPFPCCSLCPSPSSAHSPGLYLRHFDLDIYAQIGLVMLIGLAAKNAILIVEFARDEMNKGRDVVDAALEGAKLRLRPILMTSFAFILGCVPLAIASGSGAVGRQILGTVVVTGMLAATAWPSSSFRFLFVLFERIALKLQDEAAHGEIQAGGIAGAARCSRRRRLMRRTPSRILAGALSGGSCWPDAPWDRTISVPPLTLRKHFAVRLPRHFCTLPSGMRSGRRSFKTQQLQTLIRTALQQNYDVRIAAARIAQAQAQVSITRGNELPSAAVILEEQRQPERAVEVLRPLRNKQYRTWAWFSVGSGFLGQVSPRHRSRARSIAGQRLGAARSDYLGGSQRSFRLFHRSASRIWRSRFRSRLLPPIRIR